jgi:hypothetical protein
MDCGSRAEAADERVPNGRGLAEVAAVRARVRVKANKRERVS